ncbi:sugar phosphate isomerase/epimerase family protein [Vallitalea okinawensis]|uniref:sugar phosphate isomerase/epimerase family protein n=1 Tax=Vallitalea okinawensis TaxID=2078660 RepID=UPI000CFDA162|nr:sugar phosphate isomerase/epimerase family protein [Vallitalea okinawensis]
MKIGVRVNLRKNNDVKKEFEKVREFNMDNCQLDCWDPEMFTDEIAEEVKEAMKTTGVSITAFWCGWQGPKVWNFIEGPVTLGLVPTAYRFVRMQNLMDGSDFAKKLGVNQIVTHAGFMPENPNDPIYTEVISALRTVADYCKSNGQEFLFETGQETPTTLVRVIDDIGTGNLGINLDPANLLLYGKANAVDAVRIFGALIKGVHAKDGDYPTNSRELGEEKPLGEGEVNFPAFIEALKEVGYDGALTIEREIEGDKQIKDIIHAKQLLETLI